MGTTGASGTTIIPERLTGSAELSVSIRFSVKIDPPAGFVNRTSFICFPWHAILSCARAAGRDPPPPVGRRWARSITAAIA